MAKILGFLHRLEWYSPYTNPPDGEERVLAEVFMAANEEGCRQCPREIEDLYLELRRRKNGSTGYSHTIRALSAPVKSRDPEFLARIRVNRMEKRMRERFPLFAEEYIREELRKNGAYYEGITDPAIEEAREAAELEHAELLKRLGLI